MTKNRYFLDDLVEQLLTPSDVDGKQVEVDCGELAGVHLIAGPATDTSDPASRRFHSKFEIKDKILRLDARPSDQEPAAVILQNFAIRNSTTSNSPHEVAFVSCLFINCRVYLRHTYRDCEFDGCEVVGREIHPAADAEHALQNAISINERLRYIETFEKFIAMTIHHYRDVGSEPFPLDRITIQAVESCRFVCCRAESLSGVFRFTNFVECRCCGVMFIESLLVDTSLRKCHVIGAGFVGTVISGGSLEIRGTSSFRFDRCEFNDTKKPAMSVYSLESLGPERGGLTSADLRRIDVVDDSLELRRMFAGFSRVAFYTAVAWFITPYVAFAARKWVAALLDTEGKTSPFLLQLLKHIYNGGASDAAWGRPSLSLVTVVFGIIYTAVRIMLFRKVQQLETEESLTGVRPYFSLDEQSMYLTWRRWLQIANVLFAVAAALAVWNTLSFATAEVPES